MLEAYYSLTHSPFSKETSVSFASKGFSEAKARLQYLQKVKGIGLLTGEPGAGKTFVLRSFADGLNSSLFKVIYFPLSTGTVMDFYRGIVSGLGEEPRYRKVELFEQLQSRIYSLYKDKKITPVFVLDEMHMAPNKMLLDLGLIFNFRMDSWNPFVLILSGLPSLQNRLNLASSQPLNQRIVMRYGLEPLDKEEVKYYIEHHLQEAGVKHPIFNEEALEAIASLSQGWPRVVNNLCLNCLLLGAQAKKELIDEEMVRLAAAETGM